jgi:hypothetical protein
MRRNDGDGRILPLEVAVFEFMNAEDFKRLGALTGKEIANQERLGVV